MIVWPNSTGHIQKAATLSCFPTTEAAGSTPLPPCCSASHFLRCLHCCHLHALWKLKGHMQSWHMELEEVVEYIFYIHMESWIWNFQTFCICLDVGPALWNCTFSNKEQKQTCLKVRNFSYHISSKSTDAFNSQVYHRNEGIWQG